MHFAVSVDAAEQLASGQRKGRVQQGEAITGDLGGAALAAPERVPWFMRAKTWSVAYRVALVLLLLVGVYFRSRRYFFDPLGLWMDEAMWGLRLLTRPLTELEFRPIGYMALTKLIVKVHCDERTLRCLSWLASIATLLLSADLAKYLFSSRWVRLLCVAVMAYQPLLIDMAREFKPYAFEFFVHFGLVWLFVRWHASRSRGWLSVLLAAAVLAFPFAYNVVFSLPCVFGLLAYGFWRQKAYRQLAATLLAAVFALALIATTYFGVLRGTTHDSDGNAQFWGNKYDVFWVHTPQSSWLSEPTWFARKYLDLAAFPGLHGDKLVKRATSVTELTRSLGEVGEKVWLTLHLVGLVALLKYRRERFFLLVGPLLVCIAFNLLKQWPFGAFRTNVFLLAYGVLIPLVGVDALLCARVKYTRWAGAVGAALLFVTNLSAAFEPHGRKHFFSSQTEIAAVVERMLEIRAQQPPERRTQRTVAFFDNATCTPFIFEARQNDTIKRAFGPLEQAFEIRCMPASVAATSKLLHRLAGQDFFLIIGDDRKMSAYHQMLVHDSKVLVDESVRGIEDLYFATAL